MDHRHQVKSQGRLLVALLFFICSFLAHATRAQVMMSQGFQQTFCAGSETYTYQSPDYTSYYSWYAHGAVSTGGYGLRSITVNWSGKVLPVTLYVDHYNEVWVPGDCPPDMICDISALSTIEENNKKKKKDKYVKLEPKSKDSAQLSTQQVPPPDGGGGSYQLQYSHTTSITVTRLSTPAAVTSMSGPTSASPNCDVTYTVTAPALSAGATFVWSVSNGTVKSSSGTSAVVAFTGSGTGIVSVSQRNSCGTSAAFSRSVSVTVPATPANLTGPVEVCAGGAGNFSVTAVAGYTYEWSLPSGASLVAGAGTAAVNIQFGTSGGSVSVRARDNCGNYSASVGRTVSVLQTAAPSPVSASWQQGLCPGNRVIFSVQQNTGSTYRWTLSGGAVFTATGSSTLVGTAASPASSAEVTVGASATGTVILSVEQVGSCGTSAAYSKSFAIPAAPPAPGAITGPAYVCPDVPVEYTVTNRTGYTYEWTLPNGSILNTSTNKAAFIPVASFASGQLRVRLYDGCQYSAYSTLAVQKRSDKVASLSLTDAAITGVKNLYLTSCSDLQLCQPKELRKAVVKARFDFGETFDFGSSSVTYNSAVTLRIRSLYMGAYTTGIDKIVSLGLSGNIPEQLFALDFTQHHPQTDQLEVSVLGFVPPTGTTKPPVRLHISFEEEFAYNVAGMAVTLPAANPGSRNTAAGAQRTFEQDFYWQVACVDVKHFQLQLVRIGEGAATGNNWIDATKNGPLLQAEEARWAEDGRKALLLEVEHAKLVGESFKHRFTLAEGTGNYKWRVRAIGSLPGGIGNPANWGPWSATGAFYYVQPDADRNWIYSRTFTEGDRVSESLRFANGLQQAGQTQVRQSSLNGVVASQTLQDFAGRDALQTLPIPLPAADAQLGYKNALLTDGAGAVYTPKNFDSNTTFKSPNTATVRGNYYAGTDNGMNAGVADAEGFAFTRTLFASDGTNRVVEQSGPGASHAIGSGRTVRTYHSAVAEGELVRIFGREALQASKVQKIITVDPNNTTSVSYMSEDGKVVATALSSAAGTTPLAALTDKNSGKTNIWEKIEEKNAFNDVGSSSSKPLFVTENTTLKVNYSLSPQAVEAMCAPTACKTCDYKIEIVLRNQQDPKEVFVLLDSTITPGACTITTEIKWRERNANLKAHVPYLLEKRVTAYNNMGNGNTYLAEQLRNLRTSYEAQLKQGSWATITQRMEANDLPGLYAFLSGTTMKLSLQTEGEEQFYAVPLVCGNGQVMIRIPYIAVGAASAACPTDFAAYFEQTWGTTYTWLHAFPNGPTKAEFNSIMTALRGDIDYAVAGQNLSCEALWDCWRGQVQLYDIMVKKNQASAGQPVHPDMDPGQGVLGAPYSLLESFLQCAGVEPVRFFNTGSPVTGVKRYYKYLPYDQYSQKHNYCVQWNGGGAARDTTALNSLPLAVRKEIAHCIRAAKDVPADYPGGDAKALAERNKAKVEAGCGSACEDLRGSFEQAVIQSLHEQGRYVEGDAFQLVADPANPGKYVVSNAAFTPTTFVSACELTATVDALVASCKGNCDLSLEKDEANGRYTLGNQIEYEKLKKVVAGRYSLTINAAGTTSCASGFTYIAPRAASASAWGPAKNLFADNVPNSRNVEIQYSADGGFYILGRFDNLSTNDKFKLNNGEVLYADPEAGPEKTYVFAKFSKDGTLEWRKLYAIVDPPTTTLATDQTSLAMGSQGESQAQLQLTSAGTSGVGIVLTALQGKIVRLNGANIMTIPTSHGRYVALYSAAGTLQWHRTQPDNNRLENLIVSDALGNKFDYERVSPATGEIRLSPYKVDAAGTVQWKKNIVVWQRDFYTRTAADSEGNLFVAISFFQLTVPVKVTLPSGANIFADQDLLIFKFSPQGDLIWYNNAVGFDTSYFIDELNLSAGENSSLFIVPEYTSQVLRAASYTINGQIITLNSNQRLFLKFDRNGNVVNTQMITHAALATTNNTRRITSFDSHIILSGLNNACILIDKATGTIEEKILNVPNSSNYFFLSAYKDGNLLRGIIRFTPTSTADVPWGAGTVKSEFPYKKQQILAEYNLEHNAACGSSLAVCLRWEEPLDKITVATGMEDYVYNDLPRTEAEVQTENVESSVLSQANAEIDRLLAAYAQSYAQTCASPEGLVDNMTITYATGNYHYTLYYYDRAGNLQRTVPPAGVVLLPVQDSVALVASKLAATAHRMTTSYRYNSLGQLVEQETPDGGISKFYYNSLGQLRFSQNAKQKLAGTYSYTKYDNLGRVTEVGETTGSTLANPNDRNAPVAQGGNNKHITATVYSNVPTSHSYETLKGYWALDEGYGGAIADQSGSGIAATLANGAGWVASGAPLQGGAGMALSLDGVDDRVNFSKNLNSISNTFTVEAWVRPTATHEIDAESSTSIAGTAGQRYLIYPKHGGESGTQTYMGISVGSNGVSVYEHAGGYMPPLLVWAGTLNTWTHIAVVYTDRRPSLYVNGTLVKTGLTSNKQTVYPSLNLGGEHYGNYQGSVDEVRVWSEARSQTQIQATMGLALSNRSQGLPLAYLSGGRQRHLTNRVNYTYTDVDGLDTTPEDRTYTYYSYDPHGNVEWLAQEIPGLGRKYMRYSYDLISGKVLQVEYQAGQEDQFFHKYAYDADNRILAAYTSVDGQIWDRDAAYEYYAHGPLKRTELGEDKVQGVDYTYTLQGWLKAINHPSMDIGNDPLLDGASGNSTGRDAFGMALAYYDGDFKRAGYTLDHASPAMAAYQAAAGKGLYNGNIAGWGAGQYYRTATGAEARDVAHEQFTYDELNRVLSSTFSQVSAGGFTHANAFRTSYTYDANGNLDVLTRSNGAGALIDNLKYHYQAGTNRLTYVTDAITNAGLATNDLETQGAGNYAYDAIGNLVQDTQGSVGAGGIAWTPYGKVQRVTKTTGAVTSFGYDASGNRVKKTTRGETESGDPEYRSTFYIRDASGNVMAVYESYESPDDQWLRLANQSIYGSSRVGQRQANLLLGTGSVPTEKYTRQLMVKNYELTDHLGNVRAVVQDKKLRVAGTGVFEPLVLSASAYYAFGQEQEGRFSGLAGQTEAYRYGYNGKEKDQNKEWGELTSYDYGFRIYNPAIARFLSVDPLTSNFASWSPYSYAIDNPIFNIDREGAEPIPSNIKIKQENKGDKIVFNIEYDLTFTLDVVNLSKMNIPTKELKQTLKHKAETVMWGNKYEKLELSNQFIDINGKIYDKGVDIEYNITVNNVYVQVNDVPSLNDIGNTRTSHALIYVNNIPPLPTGLDPAGLANRVGGNVALVEAGSQTRSETSIHEMGHLMGIDERYVFDTKTKKITNFGSPNVMQAGGKSTNFDKGQIKEVHKLIIRNLSIENNQKKHNTKNSPNKSARDAAPGFIKANGVK